MDLAVATDYTDTDDDSGEYVTFRFGASSCDLPAYRTEMEDSCSQLEIPFWVHGTQKWVTGVTKRTTCDDVIYSLLYHEDRRECERTHKYAVYENWREVERPLQGRTRIMKIWNAWGPEHENVQFIMRKINETDFTGENIRTRRKYRKSRGRSRNTRDQQSRNRQSRHVNCDHSSERFTFMENLVKLVISQERLISDINNKISDTEATVENYETKLHLCRLEQNGENYVQSAYLDSLSEDSMDDFLHNVDIENLETYLNFCDRIVHLEDMLTSEHSKIGDLSIQIQDSFLESSVSRNSDDDVYFEEELIKLQAELNRVVSSNIMQQYKSDDVSKEIEYYEKQVSHKRSRVEHLESELSALEEVHHYQNIGDIPSESVNNGLQMLSGDMHYENVVFVKDMHKTNLNFIENTQGDIDQKIDANFTGSNNNRTCEKSKGSRKSRTQTLSFNSRSTSHEKNLGVYRTNSMSHNFTPTQSDDQNKLSRAQSVSGCAKLLRSVHAQNKTTRNRTVNNRPQHEHEDNTTGYENVTFGRNLPFERSSQVHGKRTWVSINTQRDDVSNSNAGHTGIMRQTSRPQVLMKTFVAENVPKVSEPVYSNIQIESAVNSTHLSSLREDILNCNKGDDNDSNSDTGLSSMHSDESITYLETLV